MKVENSSSANISSVEVKKGEAAKAAQKPKDKRSVSATEALGNPNTKTSISSLAKDASKAMSAAISAPDIREDRVADLKKRIQAGTYKVDADKIADRMVEDHLSLTSASEG